MAARKESNLLLRMHIVGSETHEIMDQGQDMRPSKPRKTAYELEVRIGILHHKFVSLVQEQAGLKHTGKGCQPGIELVGTKIVPDPDITVSSRRHYGIHIGSGLERGRFCLWKSTGNIAKHSE